MSIADILIYTIDWIAQNTLLLILPTNPVVGLDYDALLAHLSSFEALIIGALSGFGFIAPVALIFVLVSIVIAAEFALFGFHIVLFIVRLVRG